MAITHDDVPLSRLELVVLARLAVSRPPTERVLAEAVLELALPGEAPARAQAIAAGAISALRARGLVELRRRALTERGSRALREAFDLTRTPSWPEVRELHLAALALGLRPGSDEARKVVGSSDALAAAVLSERLGVARAPSLAALFDGLVRDALGLAPGRLTLARVKTELLARRAECEARGDLEPEQLAARILGASLWVSRLDRRLIAPVLGRRWITGASEPRAGEHDRAARAAAAPAEPQGPRVDPAEALFVAVHDAIPRIGADGRLDPDSVFVSAIWHTIEHDHQLPKLSLKRFKRWLVSANREGRLVLAHAERTGARDPAQVAESEINDHGTTFHLVVDRAALAARPRHA